MKLAIFGDSYGDDHRNWQNRWLDVGPSWIDYLRQYHDVDNYCHLGASLYFSKRKFDKVDLTVYDKVIFLITNENRRFQIWPGDPLDQRGSNWNVNNVELALKNNFLHNDVSIPNQLIAMDNFFKYIYNESDTHFHDLMIQSIKDRCPNSFIIPVNHGSFIASISYTEVQYFEVDTIISLFRKGFQDARKCHMSEENNHSLGQYLHQCLVNNSYPTFKDFIINEPTRSFDHYFRKH